MSGELTGEIRYRSERHKGREILVLQVETLFSVPAGDQSGDRLITHAWRDATTADLTAPALRRAAAQNLGWPPVPRLERTVERQKPRRRPAFPTALNHHQEGSPT